MAILFVVSATQGAGKTTFSAGLGKLWTGKGKKVGYLKPVFDNGLGKGVEDSDALFMQRILNLEETAESLAPAMAKDNTVAEPGRVLHNVSTNKDVVMVEAMMDAISAEMLDALNTKALVIHNYQQALSETLASYRKFGKRLAGIVLNKVPMKKLNEVQNKVSAELEQAGIGLLGVIPEDRVLQSPTVAELAALVKGSILNQPQKGAEPVENFMLGALTIDHGPDYFGRKQNKAVLLRSDRPDMQMAALETSTRCLILSGDQKPIPVVRQRAEVKKVPVILATGDVPALVAIIEKSFSHSRFNQERKLPRLLELMGQGLNLKALEQTLGI